jgi:hypothetical protein
MFELTKKIVLGHPDGRRLMDIQCDRRRVPLVDAVANAKVDTARLLLEQYRAQGRLEEMVERPYRERRRIQWGRASERYVPLLLFAVLEHDYYLRREERQPNAYQQAAKLAMARVLVREMGAKIWPEQQLVLVHEYEDDEDDAIYYRSALHSAAIHGHALIVDFLVRECKFPVNMPDIDESDSTPLHLVSHVRREGDTDDEDARLVVVKLLVEKLGADITFETDRVTGKPTDTPMTAAALALQAGNMKIVEYFKQLERKKEEEKKRAAEAEVASKAAEAALLAELEEDEAKQAQKKEKKKNKNQKKKAQQQQQQQQQQQRQQGRGVAAAAGGGGGGAGGVGVDAAMARLSLQDEDEEEGLQEKSEEKRRQAMREQEGCAGLGEQEEDSKMPATVEAGAGGGGGGALEEEELPPSVAAAKEEEEEDDKEEEEEFLLAGAPEGFICCMSFQLMTDPVGVEMYVCVCVCVCVCVYTEEQKYSHTQRYAYTHTTYTDCCNGQFYVFSLAFFGMGGSVRGQGKRASEPCHRQASPWLFLLGESDTQDHGAGMCVYVYVCV